MNETVEMSQAARDTIEAARLVPLVLEMPPHGDQYTVRWERIVRVDYKPVEDSEWRPAVEGERCGAGAGGRDQWRTEGCGAPAVVTRVRPRNRRSYCAEHAGGRLPLEDGRVIEPVSNPLGGA